MAYVSANLMLINNGLSGTRYNRWVLDTVDPIATVNTIGYVNDGTRRGMNKGDFVEVRQWDVIGTGTISAVNTCVVLATGTTPNGNGVDLSDGVGGTPANAD